MKDIYHPGSIPSYSSIQHDYGNKKYLIIRKNGILFLLMKVYLIVPEKLKYLIPLPLKNYFYIYYPIKSNNQLHNQNIQTHNEYNKYRICLTKKDIIEEVKSFLGIDKNSNDFNFLVYNQNLDILMSDYQLNKIENIHNDIIYIKIKLNKENEKIKINKINTKRFNFDYSKENNNRHKTIDYIMIKPKKNGSELNLKKLINDTVNTINPNKKFVLQKKYNAFSRNDFLKKTKNIFNNIINTKKIDKNTTTEDLDDEKKNFLEFKDKIISKFNYISLANYKKPLVNLKNINVLSKNLYKDKNDNLKSLDYLSIFRKKNDDDYNNDNSLKLKFNNIFKKYQKIGKKDYSPIKNKSEDIYFLSKESAIYQNRRRFMKNVNKKISNSVRTNKKPLNLSLPNIIKSYMEAYKNNKNTIKSDEKSD